MLNKIKGIIDSSKNIVLSAHINPDGDALGSVLAFKFMIEKYDANKKVNVVIKDELPRYMSNFEESKYIVNDYEGEVDLLIMLDTANRERAALSDDIFARAKKSINIDHHISNTKYLEFNHVEDISSTAELIYKFIEIFNISLDQQIAKFLYLGLINDTGNFRHPNVTSNTFYVASKLMEVGIKNSEITTILFARSKNKAKIFGHAMSNHTFVDDISFAYYILTKDEIDENGYTNDDSDGTSELLMGIEGVKKALFLKEENGIFKGSLRSRDTDINKVAQLFNGGGHILAAGFRSNKSADEIIEIIIGELRKK